jgi:hypothetical protein
MVIARQTPDNANGDLSNYDGSIDVHWRRQAAVATVGAAACVIYALLHFAGFEGWVAFGLGPDRHSFRRPAMIALVFGSLASHYAGYASFSYPMLTVQGVLAGLFSEPRHSA